MKDELSARPLRLEDESDQATKATPAGGEGSPHPSRLVMVIAWSIHCER